jgi:cell division septum initiation protein DivIVA
MKKITGRKFRYWSRMRLGVSISAVMAVLFCLVVITHGQQEWTPTQKGSYGRMTRDALNRLLESANDLRTGHPTEAREVLKGMEGPVGELTTAAAFFREQADRESDRCVDHIKGLENRVAEIFQEEQAVKGRIDDLDAQLAGITEKKALTENEIARLKPEVERTKSLLAERDRKLEELRKWWWVPGYGAYLAIRTLVDGDIQAAMSLRNTLTDKSIQMAHHQREFEAASGMKEALSREREAMAKTHAGLQEMRGGAEAELGNLKKSAVFLTDAGIFWKRVSRLLKIDVSQSVKLAQEVQDLESEMTKENTAPRFDYSGCQDASTGEPGCPPSLQQQPIMDLYESLAAFADTIDQGKNFLEASVTDYCGGEPRKAGGPNVSSACNIEQFTRYYEITDPKTCAFRPLNPPGCPPRPRPVVLTDSSGTVLTAEQVVRVANLRVRGTWMRADKENWIGSQRCDPGNSIYYGKVQNQDECELKCMADSTCVAWTFNSGDDSMGNDSIRECWGSSTRPLWPRKQGSGFQSGGIAPRPGGVDCSVFDDGYTNMAGPIDAIFFNANYQACIAGSRGPVCRKWFGRCTTTDAAAVAVKFKVFDPGRNKDNPYSTDLDLGSYTNMVGPSDAVSFRNAQAMVCADFQGQVSCREWFGGGVANDGRKVLCRAWGELPYEYYKTLHYTDSRFDGSLENPRESGLLDAWTLRGITTTGGVFGMYALDYRPSQIAVHWGRCQVQ